MRVGVYGGSFHPPHLGHALVAAWLRWSDRVDEVWLVPTGQHAFGKDLAPFSDRVRWCEALAQTVGSWVRVEPLEGDRPGVSYTIDTLRALARRHPEHSFQLVVGSDVLPQTSRWRAWAEIQADFSPIVVGRAGYEDVAQAPTFPAISSSEVRRALAAGEDITHLVPAAVIRAMRAGAAGSGPT